MRRFSLGVLGLGLCWMLLASVSWGSTYYVRPDGGTAEQCNGTTDALYPGSGTNQPCAWSHPFWALDGNGNWKIRGGDTLIIGDGSYRMGYGAPNAGWCSSDYPWDCSLPPLPSGPNAGSPTQILGVGWDAGCQNPPELWGTERAYSLLSLQGTSNAIIACLDLTDHSGCVEFHANSSAACKRDAFPYGDWAATAIIASDSSNVTLKNLNIHGMANQGIWAGRLSDWTLEDVRIAGNGWAGWNGDLGGDSSNSGTLTFRRWTIEWNGCAETYPAQQPDHCWAQNEGGYGDGVGVASSGGRWIIEDSIFRYNTSDGLDLLYLGTSGQQASTEVRRTVSVGNAGNQIKIASSALIVNTLMIGNCAFFNQKLFAQEMTEGDHCRALGNTLALNPQVGDTVNVINSTIVGQGDCLVEIECDAGNCNGSESLTLQNNIFRAYTDWRQPEETACFAWDPNNFSRNRINDNVIFNVKDNPCPFGPNDLCADPLFVNDTIASFDGHLRAGSPAIDSGLPVGSLNGLVPASDLSGTARPYGNGVDRGAYEAGAVSNLPSISVSPAAHDFGEMRRGSASIAQTFIVSNTGTADLVIDTISLTGADRSEFGIQSDNCSGQHVTSSGSCTVQVVFSPTSAGAKQANLSIPSNAPAMPTEVSLSGRGNFLEVNPNEGTYGTDITITGSEFGTKRGRLLLGNFPLTVLRWNRESIQCRLKVPMSPGTYDVTIQPREPKGASPIIVEGAFTVKSPKIDSVNPGHGSGRNKITLQGSFFGTSKGKVYLGTRSCEVLRWTMNQRTGESEVVWVVPRGLPPGTYDLTVSHANKMGSDTKAGGFVIP